MPAGPNTQQTVGFSTAPCNGTQNEAKDSCPPTRLIDAADSAWHYTPESLSATPHAAASAAPAAHQLPVHLNVNQSLCSTYFVTLNSKNQITIMDKCVDRPSKNSENINFSRYLGWLHCSLRSIVWYEADKSNQKTHRFASQQNVEELAVVLVSCIAQQEAAARVHTRAGAHMHNRYQGS